MLIWDKTQGKYSSLVNTISNIRKEKFDIVVNLHRFASSGFITSLSKATEKIGFDKNPFSFLFTKKVPHEIGNGKHEVERNQALIAHLTETKAAKPVLYPDGSDLAKVNELLTQHKTSVNNYTCIAPASVWFTKQLPEEKWIELLNKMDFASPVFIVGASSDNALAASIKLLSKHSNIVNLCGKLSFLESCVLFKYAKMNYVNDSAPLHLCSAMNAPVTVFYCSTVPAFGFGPLSDHSKIIQINQKLDCRPCGLHGYKACPQGHFDCAHKIEIN